MKQLTYSILLTLTAIACEGHHKLITKKEQDYQNENEIFPSDAGMRKGDILIVDSFAFQNTTKFQLERKITMEEVKKIMHQKYLFRVNPTNDCIVVINDFLNNKNPTEKLKNQKSYVNINCTKERLPIPNFWDIEKPSEITKSHLKPKSEILISLLQLGLKSSKINSKMSSMPDKIKHGVIGGVVLDKEDTSAIYFIQYW